MHMIASGKFSDKKILLIDQDPKHSNDRTWCFWQQEESLFESIIAKKWSKLLFHGDNFSRQLDISPYQYKMIRGIDFYEHCFNVITQHRNFDFLTGKIERIFSEEQTGLIVNGTTIYCDYIFNSILFERPKLTNREIWMLQHFKGWTIETESDYFEEDIATIMDFRIDQKSATAFCYVLPFNARQALVEYTLFSPQLLEQNQYDEGLKTYIADVLKISSYKVLDEEFGIIPMTNFTFSSHNNNIINIGTAGGQTKGSSGYTFNFIQKHSKAIVDSLIAMENPFVQTSPRRFNFYDSVLLNVLNNGEVKGEKVFTDLFEKNPVQKVFKFLDNETSIAEELKIISSLPTMPFLMSGIKQIF